MTKPYEMIVKMLPGKAQKVMWFLAGYFDHSHGEATDKEIMNGIEAALKNADINCHSELEECRLLVGRLARRLPQNDSVRIQAEDYLRRTFKPSDVLRRGIPKISTNAPMRNA